MDFGEVDELRCVRRRLDWVNHAVGVVVRGNARVRTSC